jgi:RimJ/RimL family protein N-acetyltransferase
LKALREICSAEDELLDSAFGAGLRRRLWQLAFGCDDWPLAATVSNAMRTFGEASADDEADLGAALWRQGRFDEAVEVTRSTLLAHPHCRRADELYVRLRVSSSARCPDLELLRNGELLLEPLGHHHIEDFRWQYDASVVELCCLPEFGNDAHWHAWLDECRACEGQTLLGIWHRVWGFIGCVSLTVRDGVGFFYYWLGPDYRGHGYAPRAGAMLLAWAARRGLCACYAKAYAENRSSQIGLAKIGFAALDIPIACEGMPPEQLFRWPTPAEDVTEEARALFLSIGADTCVRAPWVNTRARHE